MLMREKQQYHALVRQKKDGTVTYCILWSGITAPFKIQQLFHHNLQYAPVKHFTVFTVNNT